MSWKESIVNWLTGSIWISPAAMSFTEAIIQPVPPDLLFLPMLVAAEGDTTLIFWLWIVVAVSSVLSSMVDTGSEEMGSNGVHSLQGRGLFKEDGGSNVQMGTAGTLCCILSIPYKVFGWAAGMGEMKMKPFVQVC